MSWNVTISGHEDGTTDEERFIKESDVVSLTKTFIAALRANGHKVTNAAGSFSTLRVDLNGREDDLGTKTEPQTGS